LVQGLQFTGVTKEISVLKQLHIEQHYTPLTQSLNVDDPVWKAWRTMKDLNVKRLPVVKNGKVVGVVSDRDIVQISGYNGGQSMPVKEAMSLDPLIVRGQDTMESVLQSMLKKDQEDAIVVNADGDIIGVFSWADAFQFFLSFADMNNLTKNLSS
jgi:acetoin utilization protein AcuB